MSSAFEKTFNHVLINGGFGVGDPNDYNFKQKDPANPNEANREDDIITVELDTNQKYSSSKFPAYTSLKNIGWAIFMQGGSDMSLNAKKLTVNVNLYENTKHINLKDQSFDALSLWGVGEAQPFDKGKIGDLSVTITGNDQAADTVVRGVHIHGIATSPIHAGPYTFVKDVTLRLNTQSEARGLEMDGAGAVATIAGNLTVTTLTNKKEADGTTTAASGVRAQGAAQLTVQGDTKIMSATAVDLIGVAAATPENETVTTFNGVFIAQGDETDSSVPTILRASDGAKLTISGGDDATGFKDVMITGTTALRDDKAKSDGTIDITLKTANSRWNVTGASKLTNLTLSDGASLNFMLTPELVQANTAVLTAQKVTFGLTSGKEGKIAINVGSSGVDFTKEGTSVKLISSAEFSDGTNNLDSNTNLSGMVSGLVVTSTPSVVRETTTEVSKKDFDLKIEGTDLVATTAANNGGNTENNGGNTGTTSSVTSQTDALMESSLSAYGAMFAASDLLTDSVIRSRNGQHEEGLFAAARAGRWDYDTRSDLSADVVSALLGYAKRIDQTEIGGFAEMGHSSYETTTVSNLGNVDASGKHNYAGLGIYFNQGLPVDGLHLTGYMKAGVLQNKFEAPIAGRTEEFDRTSMYWGAHLGAYYDFTVAALRSRTFVSYYYDGRDNEDYTIAGHDNMRGARLAYDALNAHRVQVGSFAEYALADAFRPYVGLTFEQILSAEAKGTATDNQGSLALRSSDMEGSTGIVSVGWTTGDAATGFSFEAGLNGYFGERRGVTGQVQANWKF